MISELEERQSIAILRGGVAGQSLQLTVSGASFIVAELGQWFDGIEIHDGRDWRTAQLFVSSDENDPGAIASAGTFVPNKTPVVRVSLAGVHQEFDLRQLRFWPARVTSGGPDAPLVPLGFAAQSPGIAAEDGSTQSETGNAAEIHPFPALPPGWYAEKLLAREESSRLWRVNSVHNDQPMAEMEDFTLDESLRARVIGDFEKLRAAPHPSIRATGQMWKRPGGLLVARHYEHNLRSVYDVLREGALSSDQLLDAMSKVAAAIDHLASIGVSAHRNVSLQNMRWQDGTICIERACSPDSVELGGPRGAVTHLAPECLAGKPASAASDQFALAISYVEARTGRNPLIPNRWSVLVGKEPVSLTGLYPQEAVVVGRALSAAPDMRWPSAKTFVAALMGTVGVRHSWLDVVPGAAKFIAQTAVTDRPREMGLNIAEYRKLFIGVPRPDAGQIDAFVTYIAGKHSWYKHLPMTPPGVRFQVYLDPGAGMQRFESSDGTISFREIGADDQLFHYSMMPTREYRRQFGMLSVLDRGAPSFALITATGTEYFDTGPGILVDDAIVPIPSEVAFLGSVMVTSAVHDRSAEPFLWEKHFDGRGWTSGVEAATSRWPEESGGAAVVDAIRCLYGGKPRELYRYRYVIERLVSPERDRQRRCIRTQIERVIAFVYDDPSFIP